MTKENAGLAALLVALVSGAWLSLKSCAAGDGSAVDAGAAQVDAGQPPAEVDAGSLPEVDAGSPIDGGVVTAPPGSARWVTAYYAGWFPEMLPHERIDFSSFTHLAVGRALPRADGTIVQGLDADAARGMARARDLSSRAHAAGRKAIVMLGGEGDGAAYRSASSAATRPTFIANLLAWLDATGMDGVDLDWEEEIDYGAFLALARELRAARPSIVLTVPVFPVNTNWGLDAPVAAFVRDVHPFVDQINAMTYGIGMAGPWGGWVTWHTGALLGEGGDHPTSVASTLAAYHAAGVPKEKLGMGVGFFGINYGPPNTAPLQSPGPIYQAHDVEWRYSQLVAGGYLSTPSCTSHWDAVARMPYRACPNGFDPGQAWSNAGFLSYEDARSIAEKGAWLSANGYGGTILWMLNYDALPASGPGPLLSAARAAFLP